MVSDAELMRCEDCRVWDPENQPSVMRKLEQDPNAYADRKVKYVYTGQYAYGVQLSVELLLCRKHEG